MTRNRAAAFFALSVTGAVLLSGCKSYEEDRMNEIRNQIEMKEVCEEGGGLLIYDGGTGYRCDFREES